MSEQPSRRSPAKKAPAKRSAAKVTTATPADLGRSRPRHYLPSGFATIRDLFCFVFGVAIIGNEVFIQTTAEAASVGVGVALCGLPLVFGADEKAAKK